MDEGRTLCNIRFNEADMTISILDQSRLPNRIKYLTLCEPAEFYEAVCQRRVRGAPAIGIFAGYAACGRAHRTDAANFDDFYAAFHEKTAYLASSRPTAVNLSWALRRMEQVVLDNRAKPLDEIRTLLVKECRAIHQEDIQMCTAISEHGLALLKPGMGLLTHCNAGPLATSKYGTGLGPILLGQERGFGFRVSSDETRPLLQGGRLTALELQKAGVDVTLICDNMAGLVMKNGWVDAVLVGCDRVAANGDAANKIGTGSLAVLAKHYGIPFYVLGPTSTIDPACPDGAAIEIEERSGEEIHSKFYRQPMAPAGVACYNPAFDVADHQLITAIITEKGICRPPYTESIRHLFSADAQS
ncbi:MAG: S-methyl-5-thioribose-1-phosphate isomerase [Clostridiales bacterium]|nr:S-methyl-5-thioribose-1-phosphate isomerase [Clostridiales bacterium]